MVIDINMEIFTRKARFVAGGHTTDTPKKVTYSSVVSRDSVRFDFLIAELNDIDICVCDAGNAYLNADCREKIWTVAGPEFGSNVSEVMIIRKTLYGLKSSGAAWRALLASTLVYLGFRNSIADPDVWIRATVNHKGFEYYEMIFVYVDELLHLSHQPKFLVTQLSKLYRLKEGSVAPPTRYLGSNVKTYKVPDGSEAWDMSAHDYIDAAVKNLESNLEKEVSKLKS